jgi:chorismate mutase / prephenate dehydratase
MNEPESPLAKVRAEIDRIDDAIHDLLMRRTELAGAVRAAKSRDSFANYSPGREAQILRRLVMRHHGSFPTSVLVRIWREMMSAMLRLQGPFAVAVFAPEDRHWYWDHARDHFGSGTPITGHQAVRSVVNAVLEDRAAVGVLPVPEEGEKDPWWLAMVTHSRRDVSVVARIPFASAGDGRSDAAGALVIASTSPEPTGDDRSILAVRVHRDVSRARVTDTLTRVGLKPVSLIQHESVEDRDAYLCLADVSGFVVRGDARFAALTGSDDAPFKEVFVLGAYATPFTLQDARTGPTGTRGRR